MLKENLVYLKQIDSNFTILYVEDNINIREQTIKMLRNLLPKVIYASNGEEGLEIFKKYSNSKNLDKIDLIISDIQMPRKNGLKMIAQIKEMEPTIPVIIFSAYSNKEYFLDAFKIGIDNYILKPYALEEIARVLVDTLKKHFELQNSIQTHSKHTFEKLININDEYTYDKSNEQLFNRDTPVKLSQHEKTLLTLLIEAKCGGISYSDIEYEIWPDFPVSSQTLRALVYRLRTKLNSEIIETIPSFGYRVSQHKD